MKHERRIISGIAYIIFGVVLLVLGILEMVDSFWSGMGGALIAVGVVRAIHILRYSKDAIQFYLFQAYMHNLCI